MKNLIQRYDPLWKEQYLSLEATISRALPGKTTHIEHVGSTAVPGLAAKPIIDMDIVYTNEVSFNDIRYALSSLGYFHNGDQGIAGREAFKRLTPSMNHPVLDRISHHLYVCHEQSSELARHLAFRDCLRASAQVRASYQQLKFALANETNHDREAYADLKEIRARAFVLNAIEQFQSE